MSTTIRYKGIFIGTLVVFAPLAWGQELIRTVDGPRKIGLRSVAHYADINGDGIEEFLVGGDRNGGYVAVIDGATNQPIYSYYGWWGFSPSPGLGWAVANAGDFDGDGVPDFMGGDFRYSDPSLDWGGRYNVWSGATGELLATGKGSFDDQMLGRKVAAAGDTNGNGYADVLVAGVTGPVYLFGGPSGQLLRTHTGPGSRASVASLGDIDGDGMDDYLIGWPQDSTAGLWTGRVTLHSGADGSEIYSVYGEIPQGSGQTGDHLGRSVVRMGDVDGDGIPDFAVGMPAEIDWYFGGTRPGRVRVYSGADGAMLYELDARRWVPPHINNGHFGFALGSGRDVNGDGIPDLIVNAMGYPTFPEGSLWVFSGADGALLWRIDGVRFNVGLIGDINGDGYDEFAYGTYGISVGYQGRISIFGGGPGSVEGHCPADPNSTGQAAQLAALGPISVGYGNLSLELRSAPPGQPALAFYGVAQAPAPFANGHLCVALDPGPYRLLPPVTTDPQGQALFPIAWNSPPASSPESALLAGSTWTFQTWYRDPPDPPAGSNLSDALTITFVP